MRNRQSKLAMLFLTAALGVGAIGCQSPHAGKPLVSDLKGSDEDAQMEFWHRLDGVAMTTNEDAFHGLLLYFDGKDESADYAARVATLKSRKMLSPKFGGTADQAVDRGTLAVAIIEGAKIKGGVMLTLTGGNPRYAVRELQYKGLLPLSSPNQVVSGAAFVGIIGRLEDYQRGNAADIPAKEMLPEASNNTP